MIDLNRARKRLQELNTTRRDYSKISYSLKEGQNTLRFITKPGDSWPFKYGSMYYGLQKQFFISPEDEDDPIRQALNALMSTGNQEDAVFAKKHFPSRRVFALAVVREQEDKGAIWIDFPQKIQKQLVTYIANQEYQDITDVKNGTDFIITKTKGAQYPEYSVQPKRNPSPLAPTKQKIEEILTNTPDFKQAYKHYSKEEMIQIWQKYLNGDEGAEKETETVEPIIEEETVDINEALAKFKQKKLG